jgi:hypothetical protein
MIHDHINFVFSISRYLISLFLYFNYLYVIVDYVFFMNVYNFVYSLVVFKDPSHILCYIFYYSISLT